MNTEMKIQNTLWAALLMVAALFPSSAMAQEETGDEVKSVEIRVVEDYKAQVRAAHKISEQPSFADSTSQKIPVNVRIQPKALVLDFDPKPISPIQLGRTKLPKLPTQKFSLGAGNYAGSYANFILSSPRSKQNVWGVRLNHEGAQGGVGAASQYLKQPSYENELLADLQRATKNWNLKTQLLARANYHSYYGLRDTLSSIFLDSVPGTYQLSTGLGQQWLRTTNATSKVPMFYRSGGLAYQMTHAGFASSEHLAKTAHRMEVYADEQTIYLDLGYQFSQFKSWADSAQQFHHFYLAPITRGKNGALSYEFGLNFSGTQSTRDSGNFEFFVYPRINLQAEVLRRTLAVYGGWDGEATQQTLTGLIEKAPWLTMQQELRLSGENRGYVGMQGALVGKLQYRVEGAMAILDDALQFQRDTALTEVNGNSLAALQVGYAKRVVRTSLRGELNLPTDRFTLSTYAQINSFTGDDFIGKEGRVLGALFSYHINELSVQSQFKYVGGRYAQNGYNLGDYMDLSLNVGYEINSNLSVSLKAYNLLNQQYDLYQGYAVRGTRGLFVLNYQF